MAFIFFLAVFVVFLLGMYCIVLGKCPCVRSQLKQQNWWTVTQRRCLNGSTIPTQAPTQELAARVYQINLHCHFACDSSKPTQRWRKLYCGGESCIVPESRPNRSFVAKLTQQSLLAVNKFHAASEEHCRQCYERVRAKL